MPGLDVLVGDAGELLVEIPFRGLELLQEPREEPQSRGRGDPKAGPAAGPRENGGLMGGGRRLYVLNFWPTSLRIPTNPNSWRNLIFNIKNNNSRIMLGKIKRDIFSPRHGYGPGGGREGKAAMKTAGMGGGGRTYSLQN